MYSNQNIIIMRLFFIYLISMLIFLKVCVMSVTHIISYQPTSMFDSPSELWYISVIICGVCVIIFLLILIQHLDEWLNRSYYYDKFIKKREYYILALNESRAKGREGETFKILEKTVKWNLKLAENQVLSTHYLYGCYVDERVLKIEPIKL